MTDSTTGAFLEAIDAEERAGRVANATTIGQDLFGGPVQESVANVVAYCRDQGYLDRADIDLTGVSLSTKGQAYLAEYRRVKRNAG